MTDNVQNQQPPSPANSVILISQDLMFGSKLRGAANQQQWELHQVASVEAATQLAIQKRAAIVILDLGTPAVDVSQVVSEVRAITQLSVTVLAFAPHVHVKKLEQARQAGCDHVLSRGELDRRMGDILASMWRD